MEDGYVKATSQNLSSLDIFAVTDYEDYEEQ